MNEQIVRDTWRRVFWEALTGKWTPEAVEGYDKYVRTGDDSDIEWDTDYFETLYMRYGRAVTKEIEASLETNAVSKQRFFQIRDEVRQAALQWWNTQTK